MSQRTEERQKYFRQYIIYRIKLIEFMHLVLITSDFNEHQSYPKNGIGHEWKHFSDTLLNTTLTHFITFADPHKDGTNIKKVWMQLFPRHRRAIERIWDCSIQPGWEVIRSYRDNAGAHAGNLARYFSARNALAERRREVLITMNQFFSLAHRLLLKEGTEIADFAGACEAMIFDLELKQGWSFKRRWLRDWKLIESGPFHKTYV